VRLSISLVLPGAQARAVTTLKMRCLAFITLLSATSLVSSFSIPPLPRTSIKGTPFPSLIDVDLENLVAGLEQGLFTSADLVKAYTQRILEVNSTLHVVTELNPDAGAIAKEADALRANGTVLSPLHGIPILIKNNIATDDLMNNTAGSWALVGAKVPRDSTMAAKLREAGVIILGKTNLSQWANFRSFNSSNGWSAYGGQTFGAVSTSLRLFGIRDMLTLVTVLSWSRS